MINIDKGLVSAFVAGGFGLPIAHENAPYTPTANTAYVALQVLHNPAGAFDLGSTNEVTGIFQFDLRYPASRGAIEAKQMRDDIFTAFPIGREITYSGQVTRVTGLHAVSNRVDGGWFLVIGRINWRAFTPR